MVVNATMKMLMNDATIDAIVSALMTLQDEETSIFRCTRSSCENTKTLLTTC